MSGVQTENKRTHKALEKKEKQIFDQLQNPTGEDSEIFIDESGTSYSLIAHLLPLEFDIFSDNDDKMNMKKRKSKNSSRKLWTQSVSIRYSSLSTQLLNNLIQEDEAIEKLVDKYGTKRWTFIAQKLKDDYRINGRTGK